MSKAQQAVDLRKTIQESLWLPLAFLAFQNSDHHVSILSLVMRVLKLDQNFQE